MRDEPPTPYDAPDPPLYRIVEENPYLNLEEEWPGLTLAEAASRMEDLTGVGADIILSDFDEACANCGGRGYYRGGDAPHDETAIGETCDVCHGTGKRGEPWEWTDPETGREITMRREVE